jgi:tRNA nucleotidyltransferase (CCA-adding enzyme)
MPSVEPTMSAPSLDRFPLTPELVRLAQAVRQQGGRPLLVGGWVRDCLLGIPHSKDFDLEVFGMDPALLKRMLGKFGPVHTVGRHFGVLKLSTRDGEYDVSVPRRESKTGKGHKGFWVTPDPAMTFEEAAARRDFTINAMGFGLLENAFLDPHKGWDDLQARVLRHVGPAFGEDPLRVLRAMQFAGRFGLKILPETVAICRQQDLTELPRERLWEEVRKLMLRAERPSQGWRYARELGVLEIFPELRALEGLPAGPDGPSPWERTLAVADQAARLRGADSEAGLALMLAALAHELGRTRPELAGAPYGAQLAEAAIPPTQAWLARLTREADLPGRVLPLVRMLPQVQALFAQRDELPLDAVRRLALKAPVAELARLSTARERALAAAGAADATGAAVATGGTDVAPAAEWLAGQARRDKVWEGPLAPLLQGRHLIELGLKPGPHMGPLLAQAYELQLGGQIASLDAAQAWARERIAAEPPGFGRA